MAKTSAIIGQRKLAAVVLAAGGSSRLGRTKQLLRHRGEPLIARMTRLAQGAAGGRVIVVLGAERQRLASCLHRRGLALDLVHNSRWRDGLASSLQIGLRRVPADAAGVLVLLVDQARLEATDIARLVARWSVRPGRPAAAFYRGHPGAPAIIPRSLFRRIGALQGDVGARHLLRGLGDLTLVDMPAASFDVDTPADAEALRVSPSAC
jgi:molybdenum cofactor cytidylyltransferase